MSIIDLRMFTGKAMISTRNASETYKIGQSLGEIIDSPVVITLDGELGSGKTVFVKGLAAGLEVTKPVRSPTFTLMAVYQGRIPIYHFDFYRLNDESELEPLGLEEYLEGDEGAVFVEWAEKFPDVLPPYRLGIEITYNYSGTDLQYRDITFHPRGDPYFTLIDRLLCVVEYDRRGELNK